MVVLKCVHVQLLLSWNRSRKRNNVDVHNEYGATPFYGACGAGQ